MKKRSASIFRIFVMCLIGLYGAAAFAQTNNWGTYGDNPNQILDKIRNKADGSKDFTESRLDGLVNTQNQAYGETNRITNTLDTLRNALGPYIQRIVFIALSGAVILIIYNGFLLTTSMGDEAVQKDAKARITQIVKGVIVVTGAYFIIKLLLSAITYILA